MSAAASFFAGLVLTQVHIAQPDFPHNPDSMRPPQAREVGQLVENSHRDVPGMSVRLTTDAGGMIRITGRVGFQVEGNGACRDFEDRFAVLADVLVNNRRAFVQATNFSKWRHYETITFAFSLPVEAGVTSVRVRTKKKFIELRETSDGPPRQSPGCHVYLKQGPHHGLAVEVYE